MPDCYYTPKFSIPGTVLEHASNHSQNMKPISNLKGKGNHSNFKFFNYYFLILHNWNLLNFVLVAKITPGILNSDSQKKKLANLKYARRSRR